jgi:type IV secretion system protein VirB8
MTHWIASIQFAYADPSTDPKVRALNPLGFKVVDFRPEPEVLNEGAPVSDTLAVSAGAPK